MAVNFYPYWIEDIGTDRFIWFKVLDTIPANGSITLFLTSRYQIKSTNDPYQVFDFYDDLEVYTGWRSYNGASIGQECTLFNGDCALGKYSGSDPSGALKNFPSILGANIYGGLRFRCRTYRTSNGSPGTRLSILDGVGNGYGFGINMSNGTVGYDIRNGYSATFISVGTASEYNLNQWYGIDFAYAYDTGNLILRWTDENWINDIFTYTANIGYLNNAFSQVFMAGGYVYYIDDIMVYKYVEPNPVITVTQLTTGLWKIDINNPANRDLMEFQFMLSAVNDLGDTTGTITATTQLTIANKIYEIFFSTPTDTNVYIYDGTLNTWNSVGTKDTLTWDIALDNGMVPPIDITTQQLSQLGDQIEVLYFNDGQVMTNDNIKVSFIPDPTYITIGPVNLRAYQSLNGITVNATGNTNTIKFLVSRDGTNWYTYINGQFNLVTSSLTLSDITTNGIDKATLEGITSTEWASFYDNTNPDFIYLAISFEYTTVDDEVRIQSIDLAVTTSPAYQNADSITDVIQDRTTITITFQQDGDYLINYQD